MNKKFDNIIITSFMGIGNTINLIPLAEKFHNKGKKVYFLVWNKMAGEILKNNKFIEETIIIPKEKSICRNFLFTKKLKKKINPENTLFIITYPHGTRREKFIGLFYNGKYKIIIKRKNEKHDVIVNLAPFDKDVKYVCPRIFLEDKDVKSAKKYLKDKGISRKDLIGIHPGSHDKSKNLPLEDFYDIIRTIYNKDKKKRFLLFFGPSEEKEIKRFERELDDLIDKKIVFLITSKKIMETASLISLCKEFISNDSGLMHIAEGTGVKNISAFFINSKPYRNAPLNNINKCYTSKEKFLKSK